MRGICFGIEISPALSTDTAFNGGTITTGLSTTTLDVGTTTRGANTINVVGNGYISGSVGLNKTSPAAKLHIKGSSTSSSDTSFAVEDSTDTALFRVKNDGAVNSGPLTMIVQSATPTTGPHYRWGTNNLFTFTCGSVGYTFNNNNDSASLIFIENGGNTGIGTTTPQTKLHVIGTITVSSGIIVNGSTMNVPDYVFSSGYKLMPIEKLKEYVETNQHLPEFESAKNTKDLNLVQDNMRLRESIEKLTLYLFNMKQEIDDLRGRKVH